MRQRIHFPYPEHTEYSLCRSIERKYAKSVRKKLGRLRFPRDNGKMLEICNDLCIMYGINRIRRIDPIEEQEKNLNGCYASIESQFPDKRSGVIRLRHWAGEITLIHELAHHFVFIEKMRADLTGVSWCHAGGFLWAEELLFKTILGKV